MRSINKIMMLAVLLVISAAVYGQKNGDKTLLKTEVMAEKLGLDVKQKAALDKQLKAANAERKARVEKLKALREEMRRDAFVARQEREAELKEILTEEQWANYEKMKAQQKKQGAMRGKRLGKGKGQNSDRPALRNMRRKRFMDGKKKETGEGGGE